MRFAHCIVVFVASCASSAWAGNVLVVGPQPNQIAEIQAAVDAAADGDVILVKSGTYATFSVPNKSVTIAADTGQTVHVDGAIRVRNLAAGRTVVVFGLSALGRYGTGNAAVGNGFFATECAGSIRIQQCTLEGFWSGPCSEEPGAGAALTNCADVAFARCTLRGTCTNRPPGPPHTYRTGPGLKASHSAVSIHESTIVGGQGGYTCEPCPVASDAGHGIEADDSFLFAAHTAITGGHGTNTYTAPVDGGDGGNGAALMGGELHLLESTLNAGGGGEAWNCGMTNCNGEPGVPMSGYGTVETMSGTARILASPSSVARESTAQTIHVFGPPGDLAALGIRRAGGFDWRPSRGVQLLSPAPTHHLILGTIPSNGHLVTSIPMPSVPSTDPGMTLHLQLITSGSSTMFGTFLPIAVVDAAY